MQSDLFIENTYKGINGFTENTPNILGEATVNLWNFCMGLSLEISVNLNHIIMLSMLSIWLHREMLPNISKSIWTIISDTENFMVSSILVTS